MATLISIRVFSSVLICLFICLFVAGNRRLLSPSSVLYFIVMVRLLCYFYFFYSSVLYTPCSSSVSHCYLWSLNFWVACYMQKKMGLDEEERWKDEGGEGYATLTRRIE